MVVDYNDGELHGQMDDQRGTRAQLGGSDVLLMPLALCALTSALPNRVRRPLGFATHTHKSTVVAGCSPIGQENTSPKVKNKCGTLTGNLQI